MTKNEILEYVMTTPKNTNKQVLGYMLDELEGEREGGSFPFPVYECDLIEDTGNALIVSVPTPEPSDDLFFLNAGDYYAFIDISYPTTAGFIITTTHLGTIDSISTSENKIYIDYTLWEKETGK